MPSNHVGENRRQPAINDTHVPKPAAGCSWRKPELLSGATWRINPTRNSHDRRIHAWDAGSRRAFRPPDALLEPEDGALHLWRTQPHPHHQSGAHAPPLPGSLRVYPARCRRWRNRAVRGVQTGRTRGSFRGSHPLQHALCEPPVAGRHAHELQDHSKVDRETQGTGRNHRG